MQLCAVHALHKQPGFTTLQSLRVLLQASRVTHDMRCGIAKPWTSTVMQASETVKHMLLLIS
jgi:hypothetical protein